MKTYLSVAIVMSLGLATGLAGCASDPTVGEQIAAESEDIAKLGRQWTKGHKLVLEGESLIEDGTKNIAHGEKKVRKGKGLVEDGKDQIDEGEEQVDRGREMVVEGSTMMKESERTYSLREPNVRYK